MSELQTFTRVQFQNFKAFARFTLDLKHFNILVGPNNAGKSTILTAFRILAAAMRKASSRKPQIINGPLGPTRGYQVDLTGIAVSEENIFYNYDSSEPATVSFTTSNGNKLVLWFPEQGASYLVLDSARPVTAPSHFKSQFNCSIGFVPILGPVEPNERLYDKEAARLALFNYRAARNFRNIWYHYPGKFTEFRDALQQTWPGMDIERPRVEHVDGAARLYMFCPEERIPRELFWSGFGFQVWCQMLTHVIQWGKSSIFLIDEPDIYLHSDLQRQLISLLRDLGPDIMIATHSTEIISEADPDDIVVVNKKWRKGRRIGHPSQIQDVFSVVGSNLNPVLTQLAKTRRVLFVEGKDFQIIAKFGRLLGFPRVASRSNFAVVPLDGFNPERMRNLKAGMEETLGGRISAAVLLDGDFRSSLEKAAITDECKPLCKFVAILNCKEIENFLLVPKAIERAALRRAADRSKRKGEEARSEYDASAVLEKFSSDHRSYVTAQYLACRRKFMRVTSPGTSDATLTEEALVDLDLAWADPEIRVALLPGKEAFSYLNRDLQAKLAVNVTPNSVIDAMRVDEVAPEMRALISALDEFAIS